MVNAFLERFSLYRSLGGLQGEARGLCRRKWPIPSSRILQKYLGEVFARGKSSGCLVGFARSTSSTSSFPLVCLERCFWTLTSWSSLSTITSRLLLAVALALGRGRVRRRFGFDLRHRLRVPLLIPSFLMNISQRANSGPPPLGLSVRRILQ